VLFRRTDGQQSELQPRVVRQYPD